MPVVGSWKWQLVFECEWGAEALKGLQGRGWKWRLVFELV